jgi:hypothetical protein
MSAQHRTISAGTDRPSRTRLRLLLGAGAVALSALVAVAPTADARPVPPPAPVVLTGHAICVRPGAHATGVFVVQVHPLRNAQLARLDRWGYSIVLPAVPDRGDAGVFARLTCRGRGGTYDVDRTFPVARPRWGAVVVRDLVG